MAQTIGVYSDVRPIPDTGRLSYGRTPSRDEVVLKANRVPEDWSDPESHARQTQFARLQLRHEAHIIGRLEHPNICTVLDQVEEGEREYVVMPQYGTTTLVDIGEMQAIGRVATQVSDALVYIHREGLVHRDVKPGNIVISPSGKATLIDFETSFSIGTTPLELWGSQNFMSPEHLKWQPVSTTNDVYSLCATIYSVAGQSYALALQIPGAKHALRPLKCLGDAAEAIFAGLDTDPVKRPSMEDIAQKLASQFGLEGRFS